MHADIDAWGQLADTPRGANSQPHNALRAHMSIATEQDLAEYCRETARRAKAAAGELAQATGQKKVVKAMEQALEEGKDADEKLTELAESEITPALLEGASESEEDADDEGDSAAAGGRSAKKKSGGSERRTST